MCFNSVSRITQNRHKPLMNLHLKYVDDLSYLTSIDLKKKLVENPEKNPVRPLTYHNRTSQILPQEENILQTQMDQLRDFTEENEMRINSKKTKIMLFNTSKKNDFHPQIVSENGKVLDIEEEFKLLGVKITIGSVILRAMGVTCSSVM